MVYSEVFWHFGKSIIYLNRKCTLEANMWRIGFSMTSCLYYWSLRGKHIVHTFRLFELHAFSGPIKAFSHSKQYIYFNTNSYFYNSVLIRFLFVCKFFLFFVTRLTDILETKIFTCSFHCPYLLYFILINESLITLWLANIYRSLLSTCY